MEENELCLQGSELIKFVCGLEWEEEKLLKKLGLNFMDLLKDKIRSLNLILLRNGVLLNIWG